MQHFKLPESANQTWSALDSSIYRYQIIWSRYPISRIVQINIKSLKSIFTSLVYQMLWSISFKQVWVYNFSLHSFLLQSMMTGCKILALKSLFCTSYLYLGFKNWAVHEYLLHLGMEKCHQHRRCLAIYIASQDGCLAERNTG